MDAYVVQSCDMFPLGNRIKCDLRICSALVVLCQFGRGFPTQPRSLPSPTSPPLSQSRSLARRFAVTRFHRGFTVFTYRSGGSELVS